MSYPIAYYGIEQQNGLFATIKRLFDNKFWDQTNSAWIATETTACRVPLSESISTPGEYTGLASLTAPNGSFHLVSVFDNNGALLIRNNVMYRSDQKTALQIINDVQGQLRLPKSPLITDAHAQLLLSFLNEVQLNYMMEVGLWDELKAEGAFLTVQGVSTYVVSCINGIKADQIRSLEIEDSGPLTKRTDAHFKAIRTLDAAQGQPTDYRIIGRSGKGIVIELFPAPDQSYTINFELMNKPVTLVSSTDVPVLDQETILLGVKYLAKKDQGDEYQAELSTFQAKLSLQAGSQNESAWGDVEFL